MRLVPESCDGVGGWMHDFPYLSDPSEVAAALALIERHGDDAGFAASAEADHYRDIGNHVKFCRWRQIERLIVLMSAGASAGTVH